MLLFLPRDAVRPRGTSHEPVSVCPPVRLSQVGVLSKRMNESSWFLACELPSTSANWCHQGALRVPLRCYTGALRVPLRFHIRCHRVHYWCFWGDLMVPLHRVPTWHPMTRVPRGTTEGVVYGTTIWHHIWCHMAPFIVTVHCVKRKFGYLQNKGTSLRNFVLNSGL